MARRWQVAVGLVALSGLYVAGAFAYAQAEAAAQQAAPEVFRFLHEARMAYLATWGWVVGASLVHLVVGAVSLRRHDREAVLGVLASALLQLGLAVAFGVVSLPLQG
jgi:hypothetical protein